jgi:hypothetical protein
MRLFSRFIKEVFRRANGVVLEGEVAAQLPGEHTDRLGVVVRNDAVQRVLPESTSSPTIDP